MTTVKNSIHLLLSVFCVLFLSVALAAQTTREIALPNTPVAGQLIEWLRVFNSGNQENFRRFIDECYAKSLLEQNSADNVASTQAIFYTDTRGLDLRRVGSSLPQELTVLAQAKLTGLWYRIKIKTTPDTPRKIIEYSLQRIVRPGESITSRKVNEQEMLRDLEILLRKMAQADAFSGSVLVAKNNKPIFTKSYGMASKAYRIPNRVDTKFNIASIAKLFTAVSIGQLAEQGKLAFDDVVGKFLPDFPNKEVAGKVRIHHLLTHTSGLGDIFGEKFIAQRERLRQVRDYFPLIADASVSFQPGERWQYSNAGLIILGAIIEKVSGENFFDYIRNHIFKPAGMNDTGYFELDEDIPNLATGYTNFIRNDTGFNFHFQLGARRNTLVVQGVKGNPAGGAFSTVGDLLRFSCALREHKLLDAKTTEIMMNGKVSYDGGRLIPSGEAKQGYEFVVENINKNLIVGHSGGDLGINTFFNMYLDSDYTVVVLSNYDRGGNLIAAMLQERLTQ